MVDVLRCPHYGLVPKDLKTNLRFREELLRACHRTSAGHESMRETLRQMSKEDPLFYLNVFGWTYDPRSVGRGKTPHLPFLTYDYQDETILELLGVLGERDYLIEKSRTMGASWLCLALFQHQWQFEPGRSFLLVSHKQDLVDKSGDPKSLFWKLDYLLKMQPGWLRPSFTRIQLHLVCHDTGSTIDGESTTGEVARGDRRTAILLDEFSSVTDDVRVMSSTAHATRCRIFNSTPSPYRGTSCVFYDLTKKPDEDLPKKRLHWSLHPVYSEGLYTDPSTGKLRSPWYDRECKRAHSPQEIAIELDIDYAGASSMFFQPSLLDRIKEEDCCPPYYRGTFEYEDGHCVLHLGDSGQFLFWLDLQKNDMGEYRPHPGIEFGMGVDISFGTGASNSAISVVNKLTGEKVAAWADAKTSPHELGRMAVSLARWFNNAFLIWEANGPGRIFGDTVQKLGYRNFYYRRQERRLFKNYTDFPGWYATPETKTALLGEYQRALREREYINRQVESIEECRCYVFHPSTGHIVHNEAYNANDPSGARQNHADRVVADALSFKTISERPVRSEDKPVEIPVGSLAWRIQLRKERERSKAYW